MGDLVRVRLDNGVEKNVGRAFAERLGLTVLDEPALRGDGSPRKETRNGGRPMKKKTSATEAVAVKEMASAPVAIDAEEATA